MLQFSDWTGDDLERVKGYYRSNEVRRRIAEYCGGVAEDAGTFSAHLLAGYGGVHHLRTREGAPVKLSLAAWSQLLNEGADVCRSLGDRGGTLIVFDIDYMNPHDPFEPYRDPARTFAILEPVLAAARAALSGYGIPTLTLMTGCGYHLVTKVRTGSDFEAALVRLGAPDHRRAFQKASDDTSRRAQLAHSGAWRLMQLLAHQAKRAVMGATAVPVNLIDMPTLERGPFICLDLSAYGDPLSSRTVRCAFSVNQKARGLAPWTSAGTVAILSRQVEPVDALLLARSDPDRAAEWARDHACAIPEVDQAESWLAAYEGSELARFHKYCDSEPLEAEGTDDGQGPTPAWPACALFPLNRPNDALLTPGWIRSVTLTLWARGFHPARIVRLIASRYAESHDWGDYWDRYDRETRARFYVRTICGALADDLEDWRSFTCETQSTQGFCTGGHCGVDLSRLGPGTRKGMP